jgi:hypothetical protein
LDDVLSVNPQCSTVALRVWNSQGEFETYGELVLLASGEFDQPRIADQRIHFTAKVQRNRKYQLQSSGDLKNWSNMTTFEANGDSLELGDYLAPLRLRQFYRLVSQ